MIVKQAELNGSKTAAATANKRRAEKAVQTELSFIPNAEFAKTRLSVRAIRSQMQPLLDSETLELHAASKNISGHHAAHLVRMCSTPLLTAGEERELFRLMNYSKFRGNASRSELNPRRPNLRKLQEFEEFSELASQLRNHIVNANVRLVVSIVKKFADAKNNFDELFSEGVFSLMRAADKFDFARGYRFSTYATCAIRRELAHFVDRQSKQRKRFNSGISESMQSSIEPEMPAGLHPAIHSELFVRLNGLLSELDGREQLILLARYGFDSEEGKRTFQNLGDELGVCKERVRQLEARALRKLREKAHDMGFNPELAPV